MDVKQQRTLALALQKLQTLQRDEAFDANVPDSRPTESQSAAIEAVRKGELGVVAVRGGNQSFLESSLVTMSDGSLKRIKDVAPGDSVLVFEEATQSYVAAPVLNLWRNGVHQVYCTKVTGNLTLNVTPRHEMVVPTRSGKINKVAAEETTTFALMQEPVFTPQFTNSQEEKDAELLGFLIGDGCFTKLDKGQKFRGLQFSTARKEYIEYVSRLLRPNYYLRDCKNGDYFISIDNRISQSNFYINWIRELGLSGKYAHQKSVPELVMTGSLEIKLKFIQGLIATDGSITSNSLEFYTSSTQLAEDIVSLLLGMGVVCSVLKGVPKKETHNPDYTVRVRGFRGYTWLTSHLKVPSKPSRMHTKRPKTNKIWKTVKVNDRICIGEHEVYDLHVDHPDHNFICDGFLVGNSGKSQIGARITTWLLQENFPNWSKNHQWRGSTQILVLARTLKQAEESLWKKMEPFLTPGSYKVSRQGGVLSKVTHIPTGNTILFFSHDNIKLARERVQSFSAHFAWIDELPANAKFIEEVQRRLQAMNGQLLLTYTPKAPAPDIKKYVEELKEPTGKQFILRALDNPVYTKADKERLLDSIKSFSKEYQQTVLTGEWLQPDEMVYQFNYDTMVKAPPNYSPAWRHVEASDPALSSAHGLILAAEDPSSGHWYIIKALYLKNMLVPQTLVDAVQREVANVNLVRRIADPHEVWYIQHCNAMGITYMTPYNKTQRKNELIKNLQTALGNKLFIAPWCSDLVDELGSQHMNEEGTRIVKASRYHLIDASQYLVDCLPSKEKVGSTLSHDAALRLANQQRIKAEAAAKLKKVKPYKPMKVRRRRWR